MNDGVWYSLVIKKSEHEARFFIISQYLKTYFEQLADKMALRFTTPRELVEVPIR